MAIRQFEYHVEDDDIGLRLDQLAAQVFDEFSRARLQAWIKSGQLLVDGKQWRTRDKLIGGETLLLAVEEDIETEAQPQAIPLEIVDEDEDLIIINKPAGLVVHPGAGVPNGTLLNALLHHYPEVAQLPRAGIVHRLDKETSGIMVVARSLLAHKSLVDQLQDRTMGREYEAVVMGELTGGGTVDKPIGRHPTSRIKMAVLAHSQQAKPATTHYRLIRRYSRYTHIRCQLETGRTHQIRVHMAHIKHPLVGDPVYLGRQRWQAGTPEELKTVLQSFNRQALHARVLELVHPRTGDLMTFETPLPEDFEQLLQALDDDNRRNFDGVQ